MKSIGSHEVHVIGGGLGGLTSAALIAQAGHSVTVHERRGRLGGLATTDLRRGYRFNQGPHALYLGGEGVGILKRLGIRPRGVSPATKGALMVRDGKTYQAPFGVGSMARTKLLGTRDKAELVRVLLRIQRFEPGSVANLTAREWVDGLTARPQVADVIHALARLSTYVNAPDQLSAEVVSSQLRLALGDGVIYLDDGWQQLVDALEQAVVDAGGIISTGEALIELPDAPVVIVAVGGPALASTLTGHPFAPGIAAYTSSLDLGLVASPVHQFAIGIDEPHYLSAQGVAGGMTPQGAASVSLARYLEPGEEPDRDALEGFARHAGIVPGDIVEKRYLHQMCTVTAIATAEQGGYSGRPSVEVPDRPGVFVVGDWVGRRGHLADAVLASAGQAARSAAALLDGEAVPA